MTPRSYVGQAAALARREADLARGDGRRDERDR